MADAARNLSPLTMDDKTLDSFSNALMPFFIGAGVLFVGGGLYKWWTTRSQPDTSTSESTASLLSSASPVTGGRRTRKRHRKNHNRK
jgi:hypothetical protein